jgi:hypothetical protein
MKIKISISLYLSVLLLTACNNEKDNKPQPASDTNLYSYLNSLMDKGIMLGHQDAVAYGNMWYGETGRSDVKSACGDYPAVVGWNLDGIESGALSNTDSVSFQSIQQYIEEINTKGGISVVSWSCENPLKEYAGSLSKLPASILSNGVNHATYLQGLDRLADFFLALKDENGKQIPVIFRPFPNNNHSSLWWSASHCTPEEYKALWRMTADYLRNRKNVRHLLYAYSVYSPRSINTLTETYPGNEYVDIVGTDIFLDLENDGNGEIYKQDLDLSLSLITGFTNKQNKIPAVTNTGLEGIKIANYFTNLVYPVISKYKLSYILFERNAWNIEEYYFIPAPGHPASDNFVDFVNKPEILTMNDCFIQR